jgi:hypothetical protein
VAVVPYPSPKQPITETTFTAYKAVIKSLHTEQRTRGVCNIPWDIVWTLDCTNLHKHVKERMPELKKRNYVEKIDGELAPYAIVERDMKTKRVKHVVSFYLVTKASSALAD